MNIVDFMEKLLNLEIRFWIEEGRLRCKGPNEAFNAELNQQIRERKDEIFQFINNSQTIKEEKNVISLVSRDQPLDLSQAQLRLWFLNEMEGASSTYNIPVALKLEGKIDVATLKKTVIEVVRRHEALRTTFDLHQGEPVQVIRPPVTVELPLIDLSDQPEEERQQKAQKLADEEAEVLFDLNQDLMLRVKLLRLSDNEHIFLLTTHHIASDGWSMGLLIREITTLYQAYINHHPSPLPELTVQYADYAYWQKNWFQGDVLTKHQQYWTKQLAGIPDQHSLPLDFSRPTEQTYNGDCLNYHVDQGLPQLLTTFSRDIGVTPFMTLHAVFSLLLARYGNSTDIVVGTPIANRSHVDLEPIIGFFTNTLVLRNDLSDDPTFIELVKQSQKVSTEAFEHQHISFEQLVEELQPERSLNHSPVFQIMFLLHNNESVEMEIPGLKVSKVQQQQNTARYDLSLNVTELEGKLSIAWEFNTDLFQKSTIERMAENFQVLLHEVLSSPEKKISSYSLLNQQEKERLLVEWNQTERDYPAEQSITDLFEEQAAKNPNKVAFSFEGQQMSYRALNEQANQLAHYLIAKGVNSGDLVGLCLERSTEMVIGLLAILKAGAAYVPLDPIYPKERLLVMLEDAQVKQLLTRQSLNHLFQGESIPQLMMEEARESMQTMETFPPKIEWTPESLAYVIYTSGTTGKPKGVCINHRNLVNFLYTMAEKPGFTANDTLLSVTTICFDIYGLELYLPLLFGGTHYLVGTEVALDPSLLKQHLNDSGATVMQATPTTWKMLLDSEWEPTSRLKVLCGGEAMPQNLARSLTAMEQVELWNMYGPTETTIWSSVEQIVDGNQKITVGKPIANTQFYILDENLTPVPTGAVGEICIGGDGVAPGYWNRPELTEEKFLKNPFNPSLPPIYRTGDLGRYDSNGKIECLGRKDQQVKIRGFRIELEDIEYHLNRFPTMQEAVVQIEGNNEEKKVVAWLVAKQDESIDYEALKTALQKELPAYMIPTEFYLLDSIPKTLNGKVDRKQMAQMKSNKVVSTVPVLPLRNETEKRVAAVWQKVLKTEEIGRNQNFFDMGGHSMLLIPLAKGLNESFQKQISIAKIFMFPTVQQMAEYFDSDQEQKKQENFSRIEAKSAARKASRARKRR